MKFLKEYLTYEFLFVVSAFALAIAFWVGTPALFIYTMVEDYKRERIEKVTCKELDPQYGKLYVLKKGFNKGRPLRAIDVDSLRIYVKNQDFEKWVYCSELETLK